MARRKNPVYARILRDAHAGRVNYPRDPWKFFLTFEEGSGLSVLQGHEIKAVVNGKELARMVGAIPASTMDDEDYKAVLRVMDLLRGGEFNEPEAQPDSAVT